MPTFVALQKLAVIDGSLFISPKSNTSAVPVQ
jgi:hypothetical protein